MRSTHTFVSLSQRIIKNAASLSSRFLSSARASKDDFYRVSEFNPQATAAAASSTLMGEIIDHAVDLTKARPGETIEVPYEVTISESFRDFWQSAFYSHDRINTSTPFARALGLQDQVVPFSLMLFLAGSMSHADHAKLQVGFNSARYHWPAFAGDTMKKAFTIQSIRTTSDKRHSLCTIRCTLVNQRGVTVFSCLKTMLFPFAVPPSTVDLTSDSKAMSKDDSDHNNSSSSNSPFLQHLLTAALPALNERGSQTLASVRPGQVILHTLSRPISSTHSMQLATLGRLTHERHFNTRQFRREEMLVPGGLVAALTCSLSGRDLHEVLFEEQSACSFPNHLAPGDNVAAMTFVAALDEHVSGEVEALSVRTIGVKNLDLPRVLLNQPLPHELFSLDHAQLRPHKVEEIVKAGRPELQKNIVCITDRRIFRMAPKQVPFLL